MAQAAGARSTTQLTDDVCVGNRSLCSLAVAECAAMNTEMDRCIRSDVDGAAFGAQLAAEGIVTLGWEATASWCTCLRPPDFTRLAVGRGATGCP